MIIKYVNSTGKEINLNQYPYRMLISDLLDYEPEVVQNNGKILGFNNDIIVEHELNIDVHKYNGVSSRVWLNKLTDFFNTDVATAIPGRLYINDSYKDCYVYARDTDRWQTDVVVSCEYKVISDSLPWIQEQTKQFLPSATSSDTDGLDFPFDFEFDFAADQAGVAHWEIDHYTSSHFLMRIYGPCENPRILVNGYPYQVFTSLASGDYLEINSRKNTVIKYLANGTTENCYNSRLFYPRIFEKIPSGALTFNWSGAFGFDVVLYIERSEPKWS